MNPDVARTDDGEADGTIDIDVDVEKFERDGYLIFRQAYTPEQVMEWRALVDATPPRSGDLLSQDCFAHFVLDPTILHIARKLLDEQPTYFGFSSISRGGSPGTVNWHRDNADRLDVEGPDWSGPYSLIRFGIYMQDHKHHSGGLIMRPGSHLSQNFKSSELVYADTMPGDLAVWNMRILHAGEGWRSIADPEKAMDIPEANAADPATLLDQPPGKRYAMFVSYGRNDAHTQRYIDYLSTRTFMVNIWKQSVPSDEIQASLANHDVVFRNIWSEIKDRPNIGQHAGHVEGAHLPNHPNGIEQPASH